MSLLVYEFIGLLVYRFISLFESQVSCRWMLSGAKSRQMQGI